MNSQHVTSLELSQRLKALGVKQESEFYHFKGKILMDWEMRGMTMTEESVPVSAYLSSELGEMLPSLVLDNYDYPLYPYTAHYNDEWEIWYATSFKRAEQKDIKNFYAKTECDARAKMLIYLLENKLLTLEKGGEV